MYSISHRAIVTYSDQLTGEIRVKIPAVSGASEVSISKVGRAPINDIWVVPPVGRTIIVTADDPMMTNIFWLHTDAHAYRSNLHNYAQFLKTDSQAYVLTAVGGNPITFNTSVYQEGIRLEDNYKFVFDYTGVYNMSVSLQYENVGTQIHDAVVWVDYNNEPYPQSATYTHIPSSHGGIPGSSVTSFNIIGETQAGGFVSLRFTATDSEVRLSTISASSGVLPDVGQPDAPAAIITFTQVA